MYTKYKNKLLKAFWIEKTEMYKGRGSAKDVERCNNHIRKGEDEQ